MFLGSGLSFAEQSGDEAGPKKSHKEAQDHLGSQFFIQDEPSPKDPEEGNEKGDRSRDGGTGSLDEFEKEDEGERGADQGEGNGAKPTQEGRGLSGKTGEREGDEDQSASEKTAGGSDEGADALKCPLHPAGSEAVAEAGKNAGEDGPAATVLMKFKFPPNEDENAKNSEGQAEKLGGAEPLSQPECRDDGAEDGNARIHERGEPGTQGEACPGEQDEGDGRAKDATDEKLPPVVFEKSAGFFSEKDGSEREAGDGHAEGHERDGTEVGC